MAALTLYRVGTSTGMVTYNSLLQAEVADHTRGRVFAGLDMLWQAGRLASIVLGGLVADTLGIQAVYILGGIDRVCHRPHRCCNRKSAPRPRESGAGSRRPWAGIWEPV